MDSLATRNFLQRHSTSWQDFIVSAITFRNLSDSDSGGIRQRAEKATSGGGAPLYRMKAALLYNMNYRAFRTAHEFSRGPKCVGFVPIATIFSSTESSIRVSEL